MRRLTLWAFVFQLFAFLALGCAPARAVQPDEILRDPLLETRARHLSAELRCMVCQNQSIDDSDAPLARDIRTLVRERLQAGASDAAIRTYLVGRFGAFILLKPPLETGTLLLWGMPLLVLVCGGGVLALRVRRTHRKDVAAPLDEGERQRLDRLLAKN